MNASSKAGSRSTQDETAAAPAPRRRARKTTGGAAATSAKTAAAGTAVTSGNPGAPTKPGNRSTPATPPLPRGGRHALTQAAVAQSQRQRMLMAVASAVKQHGYAATTVAHVITLAGVSRRTFYEQFVDIEACFLAAYEDGAQRLLAATRQALAGVTDADWRERSRLAIAAYLRELASEPDAAWVYSVDVMGAGHNALAKRTWVLGQWTAQWRAVLSLRDPSAAGEAVSDATLLALVGGLEELVRDCLRQRDAAELPAIAPDMQAFALRVIGG